MKSLKENLESILAILWTIGGISFFFCAAGGFFKGTESMQTQITQGLFGITTLIVGYYWGSSQAKKSGTTAQSQDTTITGDVDTVNTTAPLSNT